MHVFSLPLAENGVVERTELGGENTDDAFLALTGLHQPPAAHRH